MERGSDFLKSVALKDGSRMYKCGNEYFPSVTTVLSVIHKKNLSFWETGKALTKFKGKLDERITSGTAQTILTHEIEVWLKEARAEPKKVSSGIACAKCDEVFTVFSSSFSFPSKKDLAVAGGFGTKAHSIIESSMLEDFDRSSVPPKFRTVLENFEDWKASYSQLSFIENEITVYSKTHRYAGTIDAVAEIEGKLIVLDWKTSNQIHNEHALQVAAYAKAYEEMTGKKVDEAWVKTEKRKKRENFNRCF